MFKNLFKQNLIRGYHTESNRPINHTLDLILSDLDDINKLSNYLSVCEPNVRYTVLIRLCYITKNSEFDVVVWKTLGNQIPFYYEHRSYLKDSVIEFSENVNDKMELLEAMYDLQHSDILGLQFLIYGIEYNDKVIKNTNLNSLGYHKDMLNKPEVNEILKKKIPLTFNKNKFGVKLNQYLVDDKLVGVTLSDGSKLNLLKPINNQNNDILLEDNSDFYEYKDNVIKVVSEDNIKNNISIYNKHGNKIINMVDESLDNNSFKRSFGNITLYIDKNSVYNKVIDMNFDFVKPVKLRKNILSMRYPNDKIGTMDLETYYDKASNLSKVYSLGFYADGKVNTFYIDQDLNSDDLILKCLDEMLKEKYLSYTFYIHNFGNFDHLFLLNTILKANEEQPNRYIYKHTFRDGKVLSMSLSIKRNNKTYTIKLVDSINILNSSLDKLCKTFNTEITKGYFPYTFVNKNTIFYKGDKPDISLYKEISEIEYSKIKSKDWSVKDETIEYLKRDLISLYNVLDEFKRRIFINYYVHSTNSLTISGLAMEIYLRKFYNNNIPLIKNKSIYYDIKSSYFGGITEVYKPYGKNLYYYDVNSLYPYVALKDMPGKECYFIERINLNIKHCLKDLFGFYYCKIQTSDLYIGLLPVRDKSGLTMPQGYIEGWYFSEELKFAYENGYEIEVVKGYKFSRQSDVFKKYIEEFYNIKKTTKDSVMKSISKSLLNNLLGRFGLKIERSITEIIDPEKLNELLAYTKIISVKYVHNKILVTYEPTISAEICEDNNVNFKETFKNIMKDKQYGDRKMFKEEQFHDVSIAISSAVTSYARIYMNKIKLEILKQGGSIYYTDTDSIVTDISLPQDMVGTELGQFKLEHVIQEGYFISNKTYCLKVGEDRTVIVAKGVNGKNLNLEDFKKLYSGENINTIRYETVKDYKQGSVNIRVPKPITLRGNVYTKRLKIFDINNKWIDTKPIYQNRRYHTKINTKNLDYLELLENSLYFIWCLLFILLIIKYFISWQFSNIEYNFIEILNNATICNSNSMISNLDFSVTKVIQEKLQQLIDLFKNEGNYNFKKISLLENTKIITPKYNIYEISKNIEQPWKKSLLFVIYESYIEKLETEKNHILSFVYMKEQNDRINAYNDINEFNSILNSYKTSVSTEGNINNLNRSPIANRYAWCLYPSPFSTPINSPINNTGKWS